MAVFPDRIVLKNSTDSQSAIETAIQTGGSDAITQGEIVLGIETSNVRFYTKAGDGSIVTLGSAAGAISALGDLTDVDLSTPATDGQVIAYSSASGNWEPVDQGGLANIVADTTPQLGGDLDTNSYYIISASGDVTLAPATGEVVVRGGSSDGKLTLNCTANTHGVSIQSPPHADAATYTLVLPSSAGTAGQVLTSQGGSQLTWENAGAGGGASELGDLADVEVISGGSAAILWDDYNSALGANGRWYVSGNQLQFNKYDDQFVDQSATIDASPASGILLISQDGTNYSQYEYTSYQNGTSADWRYFNLVDASGITQSGNIYIKFGATGPADGQVLTWNDTNSQWEPATPSDAVDSVNGKTGVVSLAVGDLSDVEVITGGSAAILWDEYNSSLGGNGRWYVSGNQLQFNKYDDQFVDQSAVIDASPASGFLFISQDGTSYSKYEYTSYQNGTSADWRYFDLVDASGITQSGNIYIKFGATGPADGQVLVWVDANNQWEPATPSSGSATSLDPLFSKVTVLAPFDSETNGATTWTTYGSTSPTWTANSSTISNALTRWGGTTSLSVGGTEASIPCSLGTADWTIEMWVYLDQGTWNNFGSVIKNGLLADTYDTFYFGPNGSNTSARFRISNSSTSLLNVTGNCLWANNEWNHVAICRAGDTYSAYVNGEKVSSGVLSSRTFNSGDIAIEGSGSSTAYIQDFRISSGVARYSTAFYPVPMFAHPTS